MQEEGGKEKKEWGGSGVKGLAGEVEGSGVGLGLR